MNVKRIALFSLLVIIILVMSSCFPLPDLIRAVLIHDANSVLTLEGLLTIAEAEFMAKGYEVIYSSEEGFNPDLYMITLIISPETAFAPSEIAKLQNQLNRGGKIILASFLYYTGAFGNLILDALANTLDIGVSFPLEKVTDNTNKYGGDKNLVTTSKFTAHPITSSLTKPLLFPYPTNLILSGNAVAVVRAEDEAVVVPLIASEDSDETYEMAGTNPCLIAATSIGPGKVVSLSAAVVVDVFLLPTGFDGQKLLRNIIDW